MPDPIFVFGRKKGVYTETALLRGRKGSVAGLQFSGPFFEGDPRAKWRVNKQRFMLRLAQIGEAEARRRVASAPRRTPGPSYSGQFIVGRVKPLGNPRQWKSTAVVSAYGGIEAAGLDRAHAIRVQASLAGRKKAVTDPIGMPASRGRRAYVRAGVLGTTPGHEGTAHVFARTKSGLRAAIRHYAPLLLEGLR